jgi:hypothetical protein
MSRIAAEHVAREAIVYVRQSTVDQVLIHREPDGCRGREPKKPKREPLGRDPVKGDKKSHDGGAGWVSDKTAEERRRGALAVTVCGFHKTGDGHLFAWADSETYLDGAPSGRQRKLDVSAGGLVGLGTGYQIEVTLFRDRVESLGMMGFERAVELIGPTLRAQHRDKRRRMREHDQSYTANSKYALVGWEHGARGVVFSETRDFVPEAAESWSSPGAGGLTHARSAADVLAHAQRQFGAIPGAAGGHLTIAKVGPLRTVTETVRFD